MLDIRPVSKLDFVCCAPVEKNRAIYLSLFSGLRTPFSQIKIEIFDDFRQNCQFFKKKFWEEFKS